MLIYNGDLRYILYFSLIAFFSVNLHIIGIFVSTKHPFLTLLLVLAATKNPIF